MVKAYALVKARHNSGRNVTDGKCSALSPGGALCGAMGLFHRLEHLYSLIVENAASCSEMNSAAGTLQKLHVEFALQLANALTEGGLGNVEHLSSAAEVHFACNGNKVADATEFIHKEKLSMGRQIMKDAGHKAV